MSNFIDMYGGNKPQGRERTHNDHYPTPPVATYALMQYVNIPHSIWEPAAGKGWMASEIARCNHDVIASDLYAYENPLFKVETNVDYLSSTKRDVEGVITNPPYAKDLAQKFIEKTIVDHAYKFGAFLCRLTFMESQKRYKLFNEHPPTLVLPFSARFSCVEEIFLKSPLGGMVAYAWFVWDYRNTNGPIETKMEWIDTNQVLKDWRKSVEKQTQSNIMEFL